MAAKAARLVSAQGLRESARWQDPRPAADLRPCRRGAPHQRNRRRCTIPSSLTPWSARCGPAPPARPNRCRRPRQLLLDRRQSGRTLLERVLESALLGFHTNPSRQPRWRRRRRCRTRLVRPWKPPCPSSLSPAPSLCNPIPDTATKRSVRHSSPSPSVAALPPGYILDRKLITELPVCSVGCCGR